MHYYIDGYNLLFKTLRSHESLQDARDALIEELNNKASVTGMPITIIFDAHYQPEDLSITHYRHLEIIYTSYSETADDLIIKLLKSLDNRRSCTLVTSDNKLAWRARHLLVKTESVGSFLKLLNRRYENKQKEKISPPKKLLKTPLIRPTLKKKTQAASKIDPNQDDYEKIFTARHEAFQSKRKTEKKSPSPLKKVEKKSKPEKRYRSDFDRWLQIFEKKDEGNGA